MFDLLDDNGDGLVDAAALHMRLHALMQAIHISPEGRRAAEACLRRELLVGEGSFKGGVGGDGGDGWGGQEGVEEGEEVLTQLTPRRFVGVVALVADAAGLQLSEVCFVGGGVGVWGVLQGYVEPGYGKQEQN